MFINIHTLFFIRGNYDSEDSWTNGVLDTLSSALVPCDLKKEGAFNVVAWRFFFLWNNDKKLTGSLLVRISVWLDATFFPIDEPNPLPVHLLYVMTCDTGWASFNVSTYRPAREWPILTTLSAP